MNTPAFILGTAIIFRGWLIGPLALAVVVGLALEAHRFIPWRMEISRERFKLVWNVCVALFFGLAAVFIITDPSKAVASMIRWSPLPLLPMIVAIAYSTSGKVDLDILSVIARNKVRREGESFRKGVTLAYPFLFLCILSASAASERTPLFYAGSAVFLAWALWGSRPGSASVLPWLALILVSGALGYAGHIGLHSLQGKVEQMYTDWYTPKRSDEGDMDPKHCAIGAVGSRKLSNRIKLRVELPGKADAPMLLREAAYTTYRAQLWSSGDTPDLPVRSAGAGTWRLVDDEGAEQIMTIHASLGEGKQVLPLPLGAARIEGLPAAALSRSPLGTVKIENGPRMADYRVSSDPSLSKSDAPTDKDVALPEHEADVLRTVAAELGLHPADPEKAMEILKRYFNDHFQYSLAESGDQGVVPITKFLLSKRAGHCEYFATATVLLLRAAGIPARYAVGYSVREYSDLEKMFIVRSRHAHAWCLLYFNGAWHDFDTTPPSWAEIENTQPPVVTYVYDLWQRTAFLVPQWLHGFNTTRLRSAGIWVLGACIAFLAGKLFAARKKRVPGPDAGLSARPIPGSDSEFYAVEKVLQGQGLLRQPWESTNAWLEKIDRQQVLTRKQYQRLHELISLHNRYRFDPIGITPEEREKLRVLGQMWLGVGNKEHP